MTRYWGRVLNARVDRRRVLAVTGGLAAAFLAACGGDEKGGGGQKVSGLIYAPADTSKGAKRGGVFKHRADRGEPLNFDLYNFNASLQPFSNVVGSQLLKQKPGYMESPSLVVEGDLANSWEFAPDKLTLTLKLHPQAKWSPLSRTFHDGVPASVANRTIDVDDVMFSWERFKATGTAFGRQDLVNEIAPSAPVSALVKIDNSTIQMKLVRPFSPLLTLLARPNVGYFYILPKEGRDGGIDFLRYQIGAGPFFIDRYEPSVGITLRRNPNFELRDTEYKQPFVDAVELPFVTEPAQLLAQYRAGNIFISQGSEAIDANEIIRLKRDFPDHLLRTVYLAESDTMTFGSSTASPFKDVRVRQAMSYAWDRDLLIQVMLSTDKLEAAGIATNTRWNAAMPCNEEGWPNGTYKGWWLDPKGKDFGENAKYFTLGDRKKDIAEARALLSAAGFKDGVTFDHLVSTAPAQNKAVDVMNGVIAEVGFTGMKKVLTPAEMLSIITNASPPGNFSGTSTGLDPTAPDPATYLYALYHKSGGTFRGYNPNSTGASADGDPFMNDLIDKMLVEFDEKKKMQMVFDFQRYHAKMNYRPRYGGGANTILATWPALQNQGVWIGDGFKREWTHEWLDPTKAPLNKA